MKQVSSLRDCPFCGTKNPHVARIELENKKFKYQAVCSEITCQASMTQPTQEELVLSWNRCSPMDPRDSIISDLMDALETYTEEEFYNGDYDDPRVETILFEVDQHSDFVKDFFRRGTEKEDPYLPGKLANEALAQARKKLQEVRESNRKRKKVIKSRRKGSKEVKESLFYSDEINELVKSLHLDIDEDEEEENT